MGNKAKKNQQTYKYSKESKNTIKYTTDELIKLGIINNKLDIAPPLHHKKPFIDDKEPDN